MDTVLMMIGALFVFFVCVLALLAMAGAASVKINDRDIFKKKDKNGRP